MKRDESTPLFPSPGQSLPTQEGGETLSDHARSLSNEVMGGPEEPAETILSNRETSVFVEPTADELIQAALNDESQQRLWLRTIIPLLQLRSHDSDPSGRVQLAYDLMHIAACERASRLLRSDLPSEND